MRDDKGAGCLDQELRMKLRRIPSVHSLMESPVGRELIERYGHAEVATATAELLDEVRRQYLQGNEPEDFADPDDLDGLFEKLYDRLFQRTRPNLQRVVNASGVILHTNLGRAPLPESVLDHVRMVATGYSNLEFDVQRNKRGSRQDHVEKLLRELTGAESAMVVNNNAAAVLLVLSAVASHKRVIVSRGELVEIGGSFRIPDVMEQSGAELVEVGTTNKTHERDYAKAIDEDTAVLLKVHTSNYRIIGFTADVSLERLVALGRKYGVPVMHDLGSGFLLSTDQPGWPDEPSVQQAIAAGADIVTFSGDKLLGGPQAGIICGSKELVAACRDHPLARALRIDKLTLAALEATLLLYRHPERAVDELPVLRMLRQNEEQMRQRAEQLLVRCRGSLGDSWTFELVRGESRVGGGAMPEYGLGTWMVRVQKRDRPAHVLQRLLLAADPPILTRIERDCVMIDPRTIVEWERETDWIVQALTAIS